MTNSGKNSHHAKLPKKIKMFPVSVVNKKASFPKAALIGPGPKINLAIDNGRLKMLVLIDWVNLSSISPDIELVYRFNRTKPACRKERTANPTQEVNISEKKYRRFLSNSTKSKVTKRTTIK